MSLELETARENLARDAGLEKLRATLPQWPGVNNAAVKVKFQLNGDTVTLSLSLSTVLVHSLRLGEGASRP
jgi:hypothetical protein